MTARSSDRRMAHPRGSLAREELVRRSLPLL